MSAESKPAAVEAWPRVPFKGFSAYGPSDRRLFAGREEDIKNFSTELANVNARVMLLQGETGCGKSSFLLAGLIPHIEGRGRGFDVPKAGAALSLATVFIRSTSNPIEHLANRIYDFVEKEYVYDAADGIETLDLKDLALEGISRERFVANAQDDPKTLVDALKQLANVLPTTLVLIIDQGEEVITLADRNDPRPRERFFEFLARFATITIPLKLIVTLRTEYFGRFFAQIQRSHRRLELGESARSRFRDYLLDTLDDVALVRVIKQPTLGGSEPHSPHARYRFEFDEGLPERIVDDIRKKLNKEGLAGGALPVLQVICEQLYRAKAPEGPPEEDWKITNADYEAIEIEAVLGDYLDEVLLEFERQPPLRPRELFLETARWKNALAELTKTHADNTITTDLKSFGELQILVEGSRPDDFTSMVKYLADDEQSVLREEKINDAAHFSLRHDAVGLVLKRWKDVSNIASPRSHETSGFLLLAWIIAVGFATHDVLLNTAKVDSTLAIVFGVLAAPLVLILFILYRSMFSSEYRMYFAAERVLKLSDAIPSWLPVPAQWTEAVTTIRRGMATDPIGRLLRRTISGVSTAAMIADSLKTDRPSIATFAEISDLIQRGMMLSTTGNAKEAAEFFDAVVRRAGTSTDPGLLAQAARAMYLKGITLSLSAGNEDAVAAYDQLIERFVDSREPAVAKIVNDALFEKASALERLSRAPEKLIPAYDQLIARFADSQNTEDRERLTRALFSKAAVLEDLNRLAEQIAVYDEVIRVSAAIPELQERAARALVNTGFCLGELKRAADERAAYDETIRRFAQAQDIALVDWVCRARFNRSVSLANDGRVDEALAAYDEVDRLHGGAGPEAVEQAVVVMLALSNKAVLLRERNQTEDAIAVSDEIVRRYGGMTESVFREWVAKALGRKGDALSKLERNSEASEAFEELTRRYADASETEIQWTAATAMIDNAILKYDGGAKDEAVALCERCIEIFKDASDPRVRRVIAQAKLSRGYFLNGSNRFEESLAAYEALQHDFGDSQDSTIIEHLARGLLYQSEPMERIQTLSDVVATMELLVARYGEVTTGAMPELVARALQRKARALDLLNEHESALQAYRELATRTMGAADAVLKDLAADAERHLNPPTAEEETDPASTAG